MRLTAGTPQKLTGGDYQVTITVGDGTTTLSTSTDMQAFSPIPNGAYTANDMPIITIGKGVRIKYTDSGSASTIDIAEV